LRVAASASLIAVALQRARARAPPALRFRSIPA
jgi:hypothetical protein